ncbi:41790_t:CDS:2, partial [Gigaspora margarita]
MLRPPKFTNHRIRRNKNSPRQLGKNLAARLNGQIEDKKSRRQIRILLDNIEQMENQLIEVKNKLDDAKMEKDLQEIKTQLEETNKKLEEKDKELE